VDGQSAVVGHPSPVDGGADAITIPQMLSYQGKLTDTLGQPFPNGNYQLTFRLYTQPTGGSVFWSEAQTILVKGGLFSALLGTLSPIESVPDAGNLYLSLQVAADPELSPRLRVASTAYSFLSRRAGRADTAEYALAGLGDDAWVRQGSDSVLYTVHPLGIARGGAGNALYGIYRCTHVNFGEQCTTGRSGGQDVGNATVSGGWLNAAGGDFSVIGGGAGNRADVHSATVAGGQMNIAAGLGSTTIGGGGENFAGGWYSTVPGGHKNAARGDYSFAAGRYARANHNNSFVWSDGGVTEAETVYTSNSSQFRVRARGGTWFFSNAAMTTGVYLAANSNSWTGVSYQKDGSAVPVDRHALLERLVTVPVHEYRLDGQDQSVRHIGPTAHEYRAVLGYGETENGINSADADGVALAAIQALYEDNRQLRQEVEALKHILAELK